MIGERITDLSQSLSGEERTIPRRGGRRHTPVPDIALGKARTPGREIPKAIDSTSGFPYRAGPLGVP
jgi:hypothetical protein